MNNASEIAVTQDALKETGGLHGKPPGKPEKKINRSLNFFFLAGGALLIAVAVLGIYSRNAKTFGLQQLTDKAARTMVQVVHPARTTEEITLQLAGQTTPYTDAPIFAQTKGYLQKWYFDIGTEVKAGAVLAEIDTPEVDAALAQAQAQLKVAEAKRDLSKVTYLRFQYLFQTNVIAAQDRDTATDNYGQDQATVNADQANVNRLEALEAFKIVRAPFDGIVTVRNTDIGAYIPLGSGIQLFRIARISPLRVYVDVPEPLTEFVKVGAEAELILELKTLPRRLAIIGAGVIGSEYACTFAAIGTEVHLIDGRHELLPYLDKEVSAALGKAMSDGGVIFRWGERVAECNVTRADAVLLTLSSGADLEVDALLVAGGRKSNTEQLNLSAAGLKPGERGLLSVDINYRTEVPHIYAVGDVIGPPALASTSLAQGRVAMCHAFATNPKAEIAPILPVGIYTIPEFSMVGETEESLAARDVDFVVGRANYLEIPRGEMVGERIGFLKLLFRRADMRLLGVHVIGEHATELVHVGVLTMLVEGGSQLLTRACFNIPTLHDLYRIAAYKALLACQQRGRVNNPPEATLDMPTMVRQRCPG